VDLQKLRRLRTSIRVGRGDIQGLRQGLDRDDRVAAAAWAADAVEQLTAALELVETEIARCLRAKRSEYRKTLECLNKKNRQNAL